MQTQEDSQIARTQIGYALAQVYGAAMRLGATVANILSAHATARGAQLVYEELSRLSDAELQWRGLRRQDLHRYALAALARAQVHTRQRT